MPTIKIVPFPGVPGPQGPRGLQGIQGETGLTGPMGPAGDSAYDVAVSNGFEGTEQEWLDSLSVGSNADIADFTFTYDDDGPESFMTIHNHDMSIRTTRDDNQDADISINSADDVWITANDTIELTSATDEVRIISGINEQRWNFQPDGLITSSNDVVGIESLSGGEDVKGRLKFEPNNGRALLQAYGNNQTATFTDSWDTATWTAIDSQSGLTLTNASSIISFMDATGYQVDNLKISVNGSYYAPYNGASSGDGAITFYIEGLMPPEGEFTLTDLAFQYAFSSKVDIDFDEGDMLIETEDEMDIVISAADDVRINANGSVDIWATDININSESSPSSLNINTYSGAVINSARTASYSAQDRVVATLGDIEIAVGNIEIPELPQPLGEEDSPSFNQVYVTNNNGTGQNVKIGDDAWIGDVNLANYVGITGAQDATEAGIVFGSALENKIYTDGSGLTLESTTGDMNFYMDGAAYIGNSETDNRIVTVGELNGAITDAEPDEVSFTVNGGTLGTQPTFTGAPLFSGSYVKHGPMVHFQIQVDMDNITSFGTGQYFVELPFPAKYGYQFKDGCLHDISAGKQYAIGGHVYAGQTTVSLSFTDSNGQDALFDFNSPTTLHVDDNFHISGTYISQ